ncbi:MAG: hypothetical protein RQ735_02475 [Flavobacteriaceae bacterium]|nr:hypothetical protein [Flavobacteriaceae bacterium]
MNFNKLSVLSLIVILTTPVFSQEIVQQNNDYVNTVFMTRKKDYSNEKTKGSPYYHENLVMGFPYSKGERQPAIMMQYNAFNDEIEINNGENTYALIKSATVSAEINGEKFVMHYYINDDGLEKQGYFIEVNRPGKLQLLFKPMKEFVKGKEPTSGYESYFPPAFVDKSEYFILKNDGKPAQVIKVKKKSVLELMSDKEKEVKDFVAENKLDYKDRADLKKIFEFYNAF